MNFVDSGAFIARLHENDQYHKEAVGLWSSLELPVQTSNLVIAEVGRLVLQRKGSAFAAARIVDIYASDSVVIIASTREDEIEALTWMRKYADQQIGFTDCVSFAIMRRLRIRTAFTFDRHFRLAGFRVIGLK